MHECDHGFESVSRQETEKSNGYGYGHVVSAKPCSKVAPVLLSFFLLPWFLFFFDISQELNIRTLAATNPSSAGFPRAMATAIDYDALLARFDDLVAREIIYYSPPRTIRLNHAGFPVRNLGIKSTFTNNISIPVRISYQSFTPHKACFYWGQFPLR
jgi:hypothetical protein